MRTFRALVVDDQPAIHTLARETHDPANGIEVRSARSLEEADALLAEHFFHVAVVDIQLMKGSKRNVDGQTVLRMLADTRPTCRRLLLTQYPHVYRPEIFRMLDPDARIIDGAVDKDDLAHFFVDYVEGDAKEWLHAPVDITGLNMIYERLQSKRINGDTTLAGRRVVTTPEELDYVISRLFGQGLKRDADEVDTNGKADDITAISLELLEGGKSRSVVAAGRPTNRVGHEGIHCVIKVGPRADMLEELRRYDRYVRFRLSLHRRVEMLGHAVADTIGAICYSFAGKSPNDITDMHSLLDAEDPRANDMLAVLFGNEADWQPDGERARNLAGFFNRSYGLDALRVVHDAHTFAKANADDFGAQKTDDALVFAGGRIELPNRRRPRRGAHSLLVFPGDCSRRSQCEQCDCLEHRRRDTDRLPSHYARPDRARRRGVAGKRPAQPEVLG